MRLRRRTLLWLVWIDGWVIVRIVPVLAAPFQATVWGVWWHALTDGLTRWWVQSLAAAWLLGMWWLGALSPLLTLPALTVFGFLVGRHLYRSPHSPRRARALTKPGKGWATRAELREHLSAHAVRRTATHVRPVLKPRVQPEGFPKPSEIGLARLPIDQVGLPLGWSAVGPPWSMQCFSDYQSSTAYVGPPRVLKSAAMTVRFAKFPFAGLSTQTRASTYRQTRAIRAAIGPVELLDPEGITGDKSTFRWPCQIGCRDPEMAEAVALGFATAASRLGEDGEWLADEATVILRAFLLIADVAGRDMRAVESWCQNLAGIKNALDLMDADPYKHQVPEGWANAIDGALTNNANRSVGAIVLTLRHAVAFMGHPGAAEIVLPGPDDRTFDTARFLADRGSVYLIATGDKAKKCSPLLAAFTARLVQEARKIAGPLDGDRLTEPLLLSLDEAANTIPMPLDSWVSTLGGSGIVIDYSLQSRSQLTTAYGEAEADTVWNATTTKVIAGGLTVREDLDDVAHLAGTVPDLVDDDGNPVPVLTPDQVRLTPDWHAIVIHGNARVTMLKIVPPWDDPLFRDVPAAREPDDDEAEPAPMTPTTRDKAAA